MAHLYRLNAQNKSGGSTSPRFSRYTWTARPSAIFRASVAQIAFLRSTRIKTDFLSPFTLGLLLLLLPLLTLLNGFFESLLKRSAHASALARMAAAQ